jgi:hypothetical protein
MGVERQLFEIGMYRPNLRSSLKQKIGPQDSE